MTEASPHLAAATGTITVEGNDSLFLATPAFLLPDDREIAWAGAKDHVVHRPDLAWAMGNFLQTDPDGDGASANTNGHIFPTEHVAEALDLIRLTPLNMLHRKKHVIGHFVASELIYPDKQIAALADATSKLPMPFPYVESLAAIWKWHFPDEYAAVKQAHETGQAWFSMEAVADTLTCETPGCCGKTYPYKGAHHESYCKTMQRPRSRRRLNRPYFLGGAMVIPPHSPGWKNANLHSVAAIADQHPEAERVYYEVAQLAPHLEPADWEMLMAFLLAGAFDEEQAEVHRVVNIDWDAAFARLVDQPALPELIPAATVDAGSGVIVAAVPPLSIRLELAALGTEPVEQIHVTLAYLGKAEGDTVMLDGQDGEPVTRDRVAGAVAAFAHGVSPVTAEVSGWGRFPEGDDQEVTFATVDSPGLAELRSRLVAALGCAGIPISLGHGFLPHISLAYHPVGAGTDVALPDGESFAIDTLELWWGTDHQAFPLASGAVAATEEVLAE